ncbi:MAG: molybdenum cofactor guanylyltransferase [Candidatus Dormibacteraeota bacterium]|nr:molybdenum cofactor guanylyltransferase [Candidatus Dormibacteraeota bacterium]
MVAGCSLVILAGGRGRRMGRDKATLPAGDESLVQRIVRRLRPVVDQVIVAGGQPESAPIGSAVVADAYPEAGPLAGILAGLRAARTPYAWVVGCDLPDVEPGLGPFMVRAMAGVDAVVPRVAGEPQGVCAVYAVTLAPRIDDLLRSGKRSVGALLETCRMHEVEEAELRLIDPELRSFRNLNTPAEYETWLSSSRR